MKAINTKTKEQFIKVQEVLFAKGWVEEYWSNNIEDYFWSAACIEYNNYFGINDFLMYDKSWYEIISFEEFMEEEGIQDNKEIDDMKPKFEWSTKKNYAMNREEFRETYLEKKWLKTARIDREELSEWKNHIAILNNDVVYINWIWRWIITIDWKEYSKEDIKYSVKPLSSN